MGAVQAVDTNPIGSRPYRHSIDLHRQYMDNPPESTPASNMTPSSTQVLSTPPKLQSSYSSNDIPTVKNLSGGGMSSANAHAQQHFHNHNASIGRIPPGAAKRHSRELSGDNHAVNVQAGGAFPSIQSQLQANAPPFSFGANQAPVQSAGSVGNNQPTSTSSNNPYPYYQGYSNQPGPNGAYNNANMLAMGMQNLNVNGYTPQNYTGYGAVYQPAVQPRDSQQRVMQQRRAQNDDGKSA